MLQKHIRFAINPDKKKTYKYLKCIFSELIWAFLRKKKLTNIKKKLFKYVLRRLKKIKKIFWHQNLIKLKNTKIFKYLKGPIQTRKIKAQFDVNYCQKLSKKNVFRT